MTAIKRPGYQAKVAVVSSLTIKPKQLPAQTYATTYKGGGNR